ncbi:MAG TPA: glycosyltransferase family 4 protein [Thermodesulfobacteriota bacterium]|nr:glycosyltransferase family 4 protein [Thermodesulfobacteriota bacterium]
MDSLPQVLFINHSVRDGGPGRSLYYLLKFLDRTRLVPYVLIPKDDVFSEWLKAAGIYENVIVEPRFPENLKRPRFGPPGDRGNSGGLSSYLDKLLNFLSVSLNVLDIASLVITSPGLQRKHGITVIYCNGTQAKIAGALMGLVSGRPVIWHVRNIQQTRLLGSLINNLARLRAVKKIICVSGPTASQFRHAKEKLTVIHNGIDIGDYDPQTTTGEIRSAYGLPEGTIIVGSTGRIVPRKGYELFIEAAGIALGELGEKGRGVRFAVVGDTPYFFRDDHLSKLKGLVAGKGLEDSFIFTGFRDDVRPCLRDFDVFVIPSSYPDPFPRSVIEAMSFALPVVGFKSGGIVESVEDGVTGILSEPGDARQMASAISKLVTDEALRESMGKAGRERVREKFSAQAVAADIQKVILDVSGGGE